MGRKGKAMPASSSKALEVCGDTSCLGISAADIFAQFQTPDIPVAVAQAPAAKSAEDAELALLLQSLQKKDPTTRCRAVTELKATLSGCEAASLREACVPFLNVYRRAWPLDAEFRVREGLQRCLQVLVSTLQRDFQRHLRSAFPTWLLAMFDTHSEVAQAARQSFTQSFATDDKRRGVFRHCQNECLDLLASNLRHSEQSLHDELGIPQPLASDKNVALERQDRYTRVVASSLHALGELVHVCATPPPSGITTTAYEPIGEYALATFFGASPSDSGHALWNRLGTKQMPLVRRAATECLIRILQSPAAQDSGLVRSQHRSAVVNILVDETVPPALGAALLCSFAEAGGEECWAGLSVTKSLWPQLLAVVKRGCREDAAFVERLPKLLSILPSSTWAAGRAETILELVIQSLAVPRAPVTVVLKTYPAIDAALEAAGLVIEASWRWAPLSVYLGIPAAVAPEALDIAEGEGSSCSSQPTWPDVPASALNTVPGVLAEEWSLLLTKPEAREDFLAVVLRATPCVPAATEFQDISVDKWSRWLEVVTIAIDERSCLPSDAKKRVQNAAANLATGIISKVSLLELEAENMPTSWLQLLGALLQRGFLSDAALTCLAEDTAMTERFGSHRPLWSEAISQEVKLLAWPLLPWWQHWLSCDELRAHGKAGSILGHQVLSPLLVKALACQDLPSAIDVVRDLIATALLDELQEASAQASFNVTQVSHRLQLALECVPEQIAIPKAGRCEIAVVELAKRSLAGEQAGDAALAAALRPGMCRAEVVRECLGILASAADSKGAELAAGSHSRRVLWLAASILERHVQQGDGKSVSFDTLQGPLCSAMLRGLVTCGAPGCDTGQQVQDWAVLSKLLPGTDVSILAAALCEAPEASAARARWAHALAEVSTATQIPAKSILIEVRGGVDALLQRGAVRKSELKRNALATAELLGLLGPTIFEQNGSVEGRDACLRNILMWELFLASGLGMGLVPPQAIAWLGQSTNLDLQAILYFCLEEAAKEGTTWWVSTVDPAATTSLPIPAGRHAPSALRSLFIAVTSFDRADAKFHADVVAHALQSTRKEIDKLHSWGLVLPCVLEYFAAGEAAAGSAMSRAARSEWRAILQSKLAAKEMHIEPTLLYAAASIERWASIGREPQRVLNRATMHLDSNVVLRDAEAGEIEAAAQDALEGAEEEEEELDTRLLDFLSPLLRWAQGEKQAGCRGDSYATFMAAVWRHLPVSDRSTSAPRMHRHVLELLGEAQRASVVWTSPGALQLVEALCCTESWPAASWSGAVLAAVSDASSLVLDVFARAFADDAVAAACALLQHSPQTCIHKVVPLLSSTDSRVRAASARRLHRHRWVPSRMEDVTDDGTKKILQEFTDMLQKKDDGKDDAETEASETPVPAPFDPSCEDVVYTVLGSVIGPELNEHIWATQNALQSFLEWEAEAEDESSEEEEVAVQDVEPNEVVVGRSPATSSRDTGVPRDYGSPPEDLRKCIGCLSAWELLLLGVQSQEEETIIAARSSPGLVVKAMDAPELVSRALQLTGLEQLPSAGSGRSSIARVLTGGRGSIWHVADAPRLLNSASPLLPLVRLLCCILGSARLSINSSSPERFSAEAARALQGDATFAKASGQFKQGRGEGVLGYDLESLAVRVMALTLRSTPAVVRTFWEALPRRARDRVERVINGGFSPHLCQVEVWTASKLLEASKDSEELTDVEATVVRRGRQLVLQLQREDINIEMFVQLPDGFPLRLPVADLPEKVPGIPRNRLRGWLLQARQVFNGPRPMTVGTAMVMWARSFALFFEGVEDCPICYNVVELTTGSIPRKACPTCKKKFHSECLHKWFNTSSKTTCPLCNQPFTLDKRWHS